MRASLTDAEGEANDESYDIAINGTGQTIAFTSDANNLVSGDTNGFADVFVRLQDSGATLRVSVATGGAQANSSSQTPDLSADGRFVVFESGATNFSASDNDAFWDIYWHDRQTGATELISVSTAGVKGNADSRRASVSDDGEVVVFWSNANNLVANDTNNAPDIFVHFLSSGETRRVSVATGGAQANAFSQNPEVSANGSFVVFESDASNLVAADDNLRKDVFRHNLLTGETVLVSRASDGTIGNGNSALPAVSAEGRYIAFESLATNLVAPDQNGTTRDIFRRDMLLDVTILVSIASDGSAGNENSEYAAISADGRLVAFHSDSTTFIVGHTNLCEEIYLRDLQANTLSLISHGTGGTVANGCSYLPEISDDGHFLTFESDASNLVANDNNGLNDVFRHENALLELARAVYLPLVTRP
ncbi:MAG: hypothetical protein KDE04_13405 [Anaerolineales bacterium]|nr:hypothetical protein [Anaerolineales bacterium]